MGAGEFSDDVQRMMRITDRMRTAFGAMLAADDLKGRGDLTRAASEYDKFVAAQTDVLQLTEDLNKHSAQASPVEPIVGALVNGLFMYADTRDALNDADQASVLRGQAVDYANRYLGELGAAEAQRSTAASLIARGQFPEALVALHEARDRFAAHGGQLKAARVTMDLADVFQWLGDYDRALTLVDEAARLGEQAPLRDGLHALEDMVEKERLRKEFAFYRGIIARRCGRYDEAEASLRDALAQYESTGPGLIGVEYQWAVLLAKQGKSAEALAALDRLEPHMRGQGLLRPKLAAFLRAKAEALVTSDRIDEALKAINEALADGKRYVDPDVRWTVELQHATILRRLERHEEALAAYHAAARTVASLRRAPLGFRLDNAYLADKLPLFREAIGLCVELDRPLECAWLIEQIKARSLSAVMGANAQSSSVADPRLAGEFDALSRRIDALEYQAYAQSWTTQMAEEHAQLVDRRAKLIERLRFSDPRWRSLSAPVDVDMDALVAEVERRDLAVLTMFLDGDRLTTVLLAPDGQMLRQQQVDSVVADGLNDYLRNLTAAEPDPTLYDLSAAFAIRAEDLIPPDILQSATTRSRVIVVPHRGLHLVPWAALSFDGRRLFEYCPVGVAPNLSCVVHLDFTPTEEPRVSLVGPPDYESYPRLRELPAAAEEVDAVRRLYEKGDRLAAGPFTSEDATEATLLAELASPDRQGCILHVCCHAAPDPAEPMNAGLLLTDGKADAAEIARTRTSFDEVVLSACSTGWRPTQIANVELNADDCLGIPGAFLEAGARNVLVSIPLADDDATKAFMVEYHSRRWAGSPPLEAYRDAQAEMLAAGDFGPDAWIGITMYGC